jgi:ribosome biogenesis GTPase A
MSINWFPGHMNKARREIAAAMHQTDVVIEVLDARLPASSRNPVLEELRGDKPCITVLNRDDLADPAKTSLWKQSLERGHGVRVLAISANERSQVTRLISLCRDLVPGRGVAGKPIRAMVVGIPNVGKSTLVNSLKGRAVADVGNKPAVTKRRQMVQIGKFIMVADTPGVLWPKIENEADGYRLAASGAIGDKAMDSLQVARFATEYLARAYPDRLRERFSLEAPGVESLELLEAIGRRRGCLVRGGEVDLYKAADALLHDLRTGKLGRISFEEPN